MTYNCQLIKMNIKRKNVLNCDKNVAWMDTMVLNPAIIEKDGIIHMLFRATGTGVVKHNKFGDSSFPICLGYGFSKDGGATWTFDKERPALAPKCEKEIDKMYIKNAYGKTVVNYANGCIEDPRLFYVEKKCYMTVACRMFPPGAYWIFDSPAQCAPDWINGEQPFGLAASKNVTVTVMYEVDLDALGRKEYDLAFKYITNLTNADLGENRDVILFPNKMRIDGKMQYVMIERPVHPFLNRQFTERKPSIVICAAEKFEDFSDVNLKRKILAAPKYEWESNRIGASAPLIPLNDNEFLLCYHGKQDDEIGYTQNFMLLEKQDNELPVIKFRNGNKLIQVAENWEKPSRFKTPCIFITGMIKCGDRLVISYGAADERCGIMEIPFDEVVNYVSKR